MDHDTWINQQKNNKHSCLSVAKQEIACGNFVQLVSFCTMMQRSSVHYYRESLELSVPQDTGPAKELEQQQKEKLKQQDVKQKEKKKEKKEQQQKEEEEQGQQKEGYGWIVVQKEEITVRIDKEDIRGESPRNPINKEKQPLENSTVEALELV